MVIGVVSDTHGMVDPSLFTILKDVELIIHAGDIGEDVITELETIAPVIAVSGNMDHYLTGYHLNKIEILELGGKKIMVTHIFGYPRRISPELIDLRSKESPDVIIFGHSHFPLNESVDGILYLNPGSAGPARFAFKRSVALLTITPVSVSAEIIELD